ncbi:MAG: DNA primase [Cardiobacteriaceae bacterium]|nr:DNA primase [Cardiobacteriaceae bacterium]
MNRRIENSFINELLEQGDLKALLVSKGIEFKKNSGNDSFANCPFHNEKTPSFAVHRNEQYYYCFGCHKSGNALRFLMDYENLSFVEAVESYAEFVGLAVRYEQNSYFNPEKSQEEKAKIELGLELLAEAANFFKEQLFHLPNAEAARNYINSRKLNRQSLDNFALGYAPFGNLVLERFADKYGRNLLQEVGLVREKDGDFYDYFRDRIIFPIHNRRGQIIAFGARSLGKQEPKYLNSPDSNWFHKGSEFYGLFQAKQNRAKSLIVCEGYMDCIKLAQYGFTNAVAALGTAFGEKHCEILKKNCEQVYFCFDGDTAGLNAAKKALQIVFSNFEEKIDWRFVFMPDGEDPDSLLDNNGRDGFLRVLDAGISPSQFLEKLLGIDEKSRKSKRNVEETNRLAFEAGNWLSLLPNSNYRDLLQQQLQNQLASAITLEGRNYQNPRQQQNRSSYSYSKTANPPPKREHRLLAMFANHPNWRINQEISPALADLSLEMPHLNELIYLARSGADSVLLKEKLQEWQIFIRETKNQLDEEQQKNEFTAALQTLEEKCREVRLRLEKFKA